MSLNENQKTKDFLFGLKPEEEGNLSYSDIFNNIEKVLESNGSISTPTLLTNSKGQLAIGIYPIARLNAGLYFQHSYNKTMKTAFGVIHGKSYVPVELDLIAMKKNNQNNLLELPELIKDVFSKLNGNAFNDHNKKIDLLQSTMIDERNATLLIGEAYFRLDLINPTQASALKKSLAPGELSFFELLQLFTSAISFDLNNPKDWYKQNFILFNYLLDEAKTYSKTSIIETISNETDTESQEIKDVVVEEDASFETVDEEEDFENFSLEDEEEEDLTVEEEVEDQIAEEIKLPSIEPKKGLNFFKNAKRVISENTGKSKKVLLKEIDEEKIEVIKEEREDKARSNSSFMDELAKNLEDESKLEETTQDISSTETVAESEAPIEENSSELIDDSFEIASVDFDDDEELIDESSFEDDDFSLEESETTNESEKVSEDEALEEDAFINTKLPYVDDYFSGKTPDGFFENESMIGVSFDNGSIILDKTTL